jgi:hypothetical protein
MKKTLAAFALLLPIAATAADFTGPSVWAGGQYISGTSKGGIPNQFGSINADMGNNGYGVSFGGDYGFSVNDNVKVLLGASWSDTANLGKVSLQTGADSNPLIKLESKPKYSVYIAPGYKINDSTLAYVKASFTKTEGRYSGISASNSGPDGTTTFDGFKTRDDETELGYGFGLRSYVTDQIFLNADVTRTNFKYTFNNSDYRTPIVRATVAIGMSF